MSEKLGTQICLQVFGSDFFYIVFHPFSCIYKPPKAVVRKTCKKIFTLPPIAFSLDYCTVLDEALFCYQSIYS